MREKQANYSRILAETFAAQQKAAKEGEDKKEVESAAAEKTAE